MYRHAVLRYLQRVRHHIERSECYQRTHATEDAAKDGLSFLYHEEPARAREHRADQGPCQVGSEIAAHGVEHRFAHRTLPYVHDLTDSFIRDRVLLVAASLHSAVGQMARLSRGRVDRYLVVAVDVRAGQFGAQIQPPGVIAVAFLRGIGFVQSVRQVEAESKSSSLAARFCMRNELILPFRFLFTTSVLAAAGDVAVEIGERYLELRVAVIGQVEVDRAADVAADRTGERVQGDRGGAKAAPLQGAAHGPGQEADADQRKEQGNQGQVVLVLDDFLVGHERRYCRDGIPERREYPGAPHRGFGTRADFRYLPGIVQQPGRILVLRQGSIFLFWRGPRIHQQAEPDTAENEQENRFEAREAPADIAINNRFPGCIRVHPDGDRLASCA